MFTKDYSSGTLRSCVKERSLKPKVAQLSAESCAPFDLRQRSVEAKAALLPISCLIECELVPILDAEIFFYEQ